MPACNMQHATRRMAYSRQRVASVEASPFMCGPLLQLEKAAATAAAAAAAAAGAPAASSATPAVVRALHFTSVSSFAFDQEKGLVKCGLHHTARGMQHATWIRQMVKCAPPQRFATRKVQHATWHVACSTTRGVRNVARCSVRHATRHVTFNLVVPRVARVYVSLDDVGELPKDAVSCDFSSNSFDLKVVGLKVHTPCNVQHVTSGRRCSMPHASCRVVKRATCNVCRARAIDWLSCNGRFGGVAVNATAG
jgi:hypothetical protein